MLAAEAVLPRAPRSWHNHLRPTVKKDEWTPEEDRLIMDLVNQLGTKSARLSITDCHTLTPPHPPPA